MASEAGAQLAEELYRFIDRDGSALALRPDLTIPTARLAGSKLFDRPLPLRFFYTGPAFRYEEPRAGRQREFWQAGIESIGAAGPNADAEVLAFAVQALTALALPEFNFTLGHLGYFRGLIEHLQLAPAAVQTLHSALDRKSRDDLSALVAELQLPTPERLAVLGLLDLAGPQGAGVLGRAQALARNRKMAAAIEHLRAVETLLDHYGVKHHFAIDLSDVRGMDYYTGITFKAYTPQIGFAVVNGGRYDNLIGHFGPARPAVGCAFYLDRILLARTRQSAPPAEPVPELLVYPCACGGYARLAGEARAAGLVVALALGPESPDLAPRSLRCHCDGRLRLEQIGGRVQHLAAAGWLSQLMP